MLLIFHYILIHLNFLCVCADMISVFFTCNLYNNDSSLDFKREAPENKKIYKILSVYNQTVIINGKLRILHN